MHTTKSSDISVKREAVDVDPFAILLAPSSENISTTRNNNSQRNSGSHHNRDDHSNRSSLQETNTPPTSTSTSTSTPIPTPTPPKPVVDINYFTEKFLAECRYSTGTIST